MRGQKINEHARDLKVDRHSAPGPSPSYRAPLGQRLDPATTGAQAVAEIAVDLGPPIGNNGLEAFMLDGGMQEIQFFEQSRVVDV
ncbi:hypothetical protein [Pseudomonas sp. GL-B-16]|uniref:hypothetical protein n=1 Tax=Pseudomonas sp. GL-B-16 TaxID=2832373 RepID=UPI001CC0AE3D|nr:hypothetical protein [Pseudomonas sp. GL-B-16]